MQVAGEVERRCNNRRHKGRRPYEHVHQVHCGYAGGGISEHHVPEHILEEAIHYTLECDDQKVFS